MDNIAELNELISALAKPDFDKIRIFRRNPNRNTKPEWEMRKEEQIKKLRQQAKLLRPIKHQESKEMKKFQKDNR